MSRHRKSNSSMGPQFSGTVLGVVEMAALEDLGPRTVHALKNLPLPMLAAPIVQQIVDYNEKIEAENNRRFELDVPQLPYIDPKNPEVDQKIAQSLVDMTCGLLRLDKIEEVDVKASLRPLVGRPSPRSLREQRRAQRKVRW
jgi:hypothetical protein